MDRGKTEKTILITLIRLTYRYITELAALVHDIGIPSAIENYGSSAGKFQEFEGPTLAGEMLEELEINDDTIDRVCFLVSVHHTYKDVVGDDWQILLEADFLVNALEEGYSKEAILNARENIFKTETGKNLLSEFYGL